MGKEGEVAWVRVVEQVVLVPTGASEGALAEQVATVSRTSNQTVDRPHRNLRRSPPHCQCHSSPHLRIALAERMASMLNYTWAASLRPSDRGIVTRAQA